MFWLQGTRDNTKALYIGSIFICMVISYFKLHLLNPYREADQQFLLTFRQPKGGGKTPQALRQLREMAEEEE